MLQHLLGDPLGQRFEQREPTSGEQLLDRGAQRAVVHGVLEPVRGTGNREVCADVEVDPEGLTTLLFLGQRPAERGRHQAPDLDDVGHGDLQRGAGRVAVVRRAATDTISRPTGLI